MILVLLAGYAHILLPALLDDCQQDISHEGHLDELPAHHCLGHSEWDYDRNRWDHLHSWMDSVWHVEKGYDPDHASDPNTILIH